MTPSRFPDRPPPTGTARVDIPRWVAAVTAFVMVLSGLVAPAAPAAAADPPAGPVKVAGAAGTGRSWTVTLLTGDRVHLTHHGGDNYTAEAERVRRADGRIPTLHFDQSPKEIVAIPDDARAAVDAGILDRTLFDVKYLALNGFADNGSKQLPLIVQYPAGVPQRSAFSAAEALPASDATLALASVNGAAVTVDKAKAGEFWLRIRGAVANARPKALTGGVSRIWLDRKVTATLAESVPLIGAPQAWQTGLDGSGITVAVLDTGFDPNHPDLAGKVAVSKSFIDGEPVADGHGHGTHVAATVAGSGAASAGSRKGVAPGARLAIGKVLDNAGSGSDSSVLAGMEWAAKTVGAKVISMSLGAGPTDGTDPMAQAVNRLSAETGALFVIAAGNNGPGRETVNTPGTADAALTVAATSKTDAMADFSSRGPRSLDGALKPDIAAPGVDIIAARAAGTTMGTPVDANYTTASGTSMATPHVAGAAAILAQAHPDWPGDRLKTALMSTAKDAGHTVYEQGAGRVDVARVAAQQVVATTGGLDFGVIPMGENASVTKEVAYANGGTADVTLTVSPSLRMVDGSAADDAITAPASVTVPAGGTAKVAVTLNPSGLAKGSYTGALVASDSASGIRVTTPVGFNRDAMKVKLRIRTLGFTGQPAPAPPTDGVGWEIMTSNVSAVDVPGVYFASAPAQPEPGIMDYLVEPGVYAITHRLVTHRGDRAQEVYLVEPEVEVTGDTEITLDARRAVQIKFRTPKPVDPAAMIWSVSSMRSAWDTRLAGGVTVGWTPVELFATPTRKATKGTYLFEPRVTMSNPQVRMTVTTPDRFALNPYQYAVGDEGRPRNAALPVFPEGKQRLELAYVNFARPEDIAKVDLRGKLAVQRVDPYEPVWEGHQTGCWVVHERTQWLKDAGAVGVLMYLDGTPHPACELPMRFYSTGTTTDESALALAQISREEGARLKRLLDAGPVRMELNGHPDVEYTYQLSQYSTQQVPRNLTYTYDSRSLAQVDDRYTAPGDFELAKQVWHTTMPVESFSAYSYQDFLAPSKRTEYFGGFASDVMWYGSGGTDTNEPWAYKAFTRPTRETQRWGATPETFGGVTMPDVDGLKWYTGCPMCRLGDTFVGLYSYLQPGGLENGSYLNVGARLSKDGVEIPKTPPTGLPADWPIWSLPKDDGVYQLTQTHDNNRATWTFHSKTVTEHAVPSGQYCPPGLFGMPGDVEKPCAAQPLVFVGYDFGDTQDLRNNVAAGGRRDLLVDAHHAQSTTRSPAIAGVNLWYSTDDGATWQAVRVHRSHQPGVYRTSLDIPALDRTSGAISLRVEAWDAGGNRIEQTTIRAVHLK